MPSKLKRHLKNEGFFPSSLMLLKGKMLLAERKGKNGLEGGREGRNRRTGKKWREKKVLERLMVSCNKPRRSCHGKKIPTRKGREDSCAQKQYPKFIFRAVSQCLMVVKEQHSDLTHKLWMQNAILSHVKVRS